MNHFCCGIDGGYVVVCGIGSDAVIGFGIVGGIVTIGCEVVGVDDVSCGLVVDVGVVGCCDVGVDASDC